MKLSENWLRSWVNPNLSREEIGEQLTMAGLELDDLSPLAKPFSGVVVGHVLDVKPHPDADRLRIATVDIGQDTPLQIVCGASNVATGIKVPVATIGAELPPVEGDKPFKIKKGKLRGVESEGMLCSGAELDCDDGVDGLLILAKEAPIGADVRQYLGLDDYVLDIAITPNRGDCFSVRGIARELAVINRLPFHPPFSYTTAQPDHDTSQAVHLKSPACPRYLAQVASLPSVGISPPFIQHALKSSGISPRNLIVDVTNYVLLELGQPLHAFDKDKIVGDIYVRLADAGETLTLLNEETITLTGDELVIADEAGAIALAGIMGGLRTAVSDETRQIVLESAFFDPLAIAGRARRFGLHTDASQRYERGVDFELPSIALERALDLLKTYGDAKIGKRTHCEHPEHLPKRSAITLPIAKIGKLLGIHIDSDDILDILNRLEIRSTKLVDTISAIPPSHRYDIEIGEDLIEEVARIYGYNDIDADLPSFRLRMSEDPKTDRLDTLKNTLTSLGYFEAISFSFSDAKIETLFDNSDFVAPLALANPISSDLAVMRRTLLSSLLPCVQYNLNRQASRIRLFETGLSFLGLEAKTLSQTPMLTMVALGNRLEDSHWATNKSAAMDFYDLKGDVESLLPSQSLPKISYLPSTRPYLHTGQSADVWLDGDCIGSFGQLHPSIAHALDLPTTWVAEFDLTRLLALYKKTAILTPSKFPQVRRDFAFLVDKTVTWQAMQDIVLSTSEAHLQKVWLFDVYEGERLPAGKKSLAFAVVWQNDQGTLEESAINRLSQTLIDALAQQLGAELRTA